MNELSAIVTKVESFGSDSLEVVGGKFEGGICLQQVPIEVAECIYTMQNTKRVSKVKHLLEIGSAAGGNAYILNYFFKLEFVTIIDDNKHPKHIHRSAILKNVNYTEFIGDSHSQEALSFVKHSGKFYDILFIDGDHSYEGVKQDFKMYYPFLDYEGFLVFHDIVACPGVKQYVDEIYDEIYKGNSRDLRYLGNFVSDVEPKCGITLFQTNQLLWG
jgi:predicted O-methyltransferase YrrM